MRNLEVEIRNSKAAPGPGLVGGLGSRVSDGTPGPGFGCRIFVQEEFNG